jgi:signal transduction histidine kinase
MFFWGILGLFSTHKVLGTPSCAYRVLSASILGLLLQNGRHLPGRSRRLPNRQARFHCAITSNTFCNLLLMTLTVRSQTLNRSLNLEVKKVKQLPDSVAEVHAALRQAGGFNMDQMVSEYRALRASVVKLWGAQVTGTTEQDIIDLTRFTEAIDQELTESISYYTLKVERSRNLFLGIIGHDRRNPIGAMSMSAELIGRIGSLSDRQKMLTSQISLSATRAVEILDQLLDLTRVRLGSGL